jgi:carboxyl-terminal processing protease
VVSRGWWRGAWRRAAVALALLAASPASAQPATPWSPPPAVAEAVGAWDTEEGRGRVLDALVALFARTYHQADARDWVAWGDAARAEVLGAADRATFDAAMARLVRSLGDGHSSWVGRPTPLASDAAAATEGAVPPRLGVQLSYVEDRGLVVERVYPGTPADLAGLRRADVITAVGDVDLRRAGSLFEANGALAAALVQGPTTLRVERGRVARTLEVVGAAVAFERVAARPYAVMLDGDVGYLHVPSFNEDGVASDVHAALRGLMAAGARSLVFDLRGNLGGRVLEAGLTVAAFVDGPWAIALARGEEVWRATAAIEPAARGVPVAVARLERPDGSSMGEQRLADPVRFTGPVVLVVGAENASAAEVVAHALVDGADARVVGERTAGNVEAVQAHALPDGSRVLVAIADLRSASGAVLSGGLRPDVEARATVRDLARGVDPPVAEARRWLGGLPFTPGRYF